MIKFNAKIDQFGEMGEKTGWTYIEVPADLAEELIGKQKKSFRVKGKLDTFPIKGVALMPMGNGSFIMPLNADMRKGIHKKKGAMLQVQIAVDKEPIAPPPGFMDCLEDEPKAKACFEKLSLSHRNYYIKWLGGVKGEVAVAKRMAQAINALSKGLDFAGLHQQLKEERALRK